MGTILDDINYANDERLALLEAERVSNLKLSKDILNHDHYWIRYGMLYECYQTTHGKRFREILAVPGEPDCDRLTQKQVEMIEQVFLKK